MNETVRLFRNDAEARFIRRPNRFVIIANLDGNDRDVYISSLLMEWQVMEFVSAYQESRWRHYICS